MSAPLPPSQPTEVEPDILQRARILRSTSGAEIDAESLLFDTEWYRAQYSDVALAGLDPIRHYFDNGAREGRDPNALFSTNWYVSTYADVASSKMNPFLHYLLYGAREGRKPRA